MHEWQLTRAIVKAVVDAATAQGAARVHGVTLALGPRVAIAPDFLRAQFAIAAAGSIAEGAVLTMVPAPTRCAAASDGVMIEKLECGE